MNKRHLVGGIFALFIMMAGEAQIATVGSGSPGIPYGGGVAEGAAGVGGATPSGGYNLTTTTPLTPDSTGAPLTANSPALTTSTPSSPLSGPIGSGMESGGGSVISGYAVKESAVPQPTVKLQEAVPGQARIEGEVRRRTVRHPDGSRFMKTFVRVGHATDEAGRTINQLREVEVLLVGEKALEAVAHEGDQVVLEGTLRDRDITQEASKRYELELQQLEVPRYLASH